MALSIETAGELLDPIRVGISYRIIELFSAGLYSSPNKAIEELVTNSYDAFAQRVDLLVPVNPGVSDATIWVIDDGDSMDEAELHDLWRIASSRKREQESEDRPPIGRFGIGKLATYVLASKLTYVCKKNERFLAVTMDYGAIPKDDSAGESPVLLDLRALTETEAQGALKAMRQIRGGAPLHTRLFGKDAPKSWTAVAMGDLKPLAASLKTGRLQWILSTALPMSPGFQLTLNGSRVASSVERQEPLETWTIGVEDAAAERLELQCAKDAEGPYVDLGDLGPIRGSAAVYETELTRGKAAENGRSHGFFVKVRGRLINLDDPLFGNPAVSHTTFARFRLEVEADGLDEFLRSTREAVLDTPIVEDFRAYLVAKFNDARSWYTNYIKTEEQESRLSTRIRKTPASLSRRPLWNAVAKALDGVLELTLTAVPEGLDEEERASLLAVLEASLASEDEGLIKSVETAPLGVEQYLAIYDAATQTIKVNLLHPFYANYAAAYHSPEPFELMAVAEVLTEAYLLEYLPAYQVREIIDRRDRFLRELVFSGDLPSAPNVATMLLDARTDDDALEHAVGLALRSLGFEVTRIGGKKEPDGVAKARLGVRSAAADKPDDYSLTYDAKSTSKKRVKNKDVHVSTLDRHRRQYSADHALVVAPDFEGGDDPESAVSDEVSHAHITAMRVEDLALLIQVAATRQLGYSRIKALFDKCFTPAESHAWVEALLAEEADPIPTTEILETVWHLMAETDDPVDFGALRIELRHRGLKVRDSQLREWVESLRSLVPGYIAVDSNTVMLDTNVERILEVMRDYGRLLPAKVLTDTYLEALIQTTAASK